MGVIRVCWECQASLLWYSPTPLSLPKARSGVLGHASTRILLVGLPSTGACLHPDDLFSFEKKSHSKHSKHLPTPNIKGRLQSLLLSLSSILSLCCLSHPLQVLLALGSWAMTPQTCSGSTPTSARRTERKGNLRATNCRPVWYVLWALRILSCLTALG